MDELESSQQLDDGAAPQKNSNTVVKIGIGFFLALVLMVALNMN